jgi:ribosomal protein eL8
MAKSYVKFDTPKELRDKVLQAVTQANASGLVRKGTNETTKAIERGEARLVVVAEDVDPEEVVMHLPLLCGEKKVYYAFVSEKKELGNAAGLGVGCSAVAIAKTGNAEELVKQVCSELSEKVGLKFSEEKKAEKAEKQGGEKAEKKEKKAPAKKKEKPTEEKPKEEKKEEKKE